MNLPWLASFLILLLLTPHALQAQCGGTCHWGALTTLPSGSSVTIPAGTTYCIAGSVANKTTGYVIDGTLIVQGGPESVRRDPAFYPGRMLTSDFPQSLQ